MAPMEGVLTPDQTWDVVHYVRSIQNDDTPVPDPSPGSR